MQPEKYVNSDAKKIHSDFQGVFAVCRCGSSVVPDRRATETVMDCQRENSSSHGHCHAVVVGSTSIPFGMEPKPSLKDLKKPSSSPGGALSTMSAPAGGGDAAAAGELQPGGPQQASQSQQQQSQGGTKQQSLVRGEKICYLDEFVFESAFGMDWRNARVRTMDFSSVKKFRLESITAGGSGGILHPDLKRFGFVKIDLSNNSLQDINAISIEQGFTDVQILKVKHNSLIEPKINLPSLVELNLSHNELIRLPNLRVCGQSLEVLILSHNRIEGRLEDVAGQCRKLKRLDLSSNQIQLSPSQIQNVGFVNTFLCRDSSSKPC